MVVHGRNGAARAAMFEFLRTLELKPIEWNDAVNATGGGTPYTGNVVKTAIAQAGAVVVLLTGDDLAMLRKRFVTDSDGDQERAPTPQARPNVMIELGMALMADENKTIIIELENTRRHQRHLGPQFNPIWS